MFKLIFSVAAVTTLAQLLQLVSQPLLTHLYTKESFGYLSVVASIVTFSALICNFQFNNLILISKENSSRLFTSGFYFSIFMEVIVSLFLFVFSYHFFENYRIELLFLTIFYLLFYCFNVLFRAVMLKEGKNNVYSFGVLLRSMIVVFFQILLSFYYQAFGLVLGIVIGEFVLIIFGLFYGKGFIGFGGFNLRGIFDSIFSERKFLLVGTIQELTSTSMFLAPLVLIIYKYSYAIGGEFSVVHKLAWGPAFLLAQVVSPILLQYISKDIFEHKFLFDPGKSILFLILMSIIAFLSCDFLFGLLVKNDWYNAIWMSKYIVIWSLSFIISLPYRVLLRAKKRQEIQFVIDFLILLLFLTVLIFDYSFKQYMSLLVLSGVVGNVIIVFCTYLLIGKRYQYGLK